ncbi:hypothetical protein BC937DRAFT_88660, partial [Endogone sp. FLAS-F59071]
RLLYHSLLWGALPSPPHLNVCTHPSLNHRGSFHSFPSQLGTMSVEPRISQILPTVKCSDCGDEIGIHELGSHVCTKAPPLPKMPPLPTGLGKPSTVQPRSAPKSLLSRGEPGGDGGDNSNFARSVDSEQRPQNSSTIQSMTRAAPGTGPNLPFLEKYKNLAGTTKDPAPSNFDRRYDNAPSGQDRYENLKTTSSDNLASRPSPPPEFAQAPVGRALTPNGNDQYGRKVQPPERYANSGPQPYRQDAGYNPNVRPPPSSGYMNQDPYSRDRIPPNNSPVPQTSRSYNEDRPNYERAPSRSNTMDEPSRYGNNGPTRAKSPAFLGQYPGERNNSTSPAAFSNGKYTNSTNDYDTPVRSPRPRDEYASNNTRSPSPGTKNTSGYRRPSDDDDRRGRAAADSYTDEYSNMNSDKTLSSTSGLSGRRPSDNDNGGYDGSNRRPSTKSTHGVLDSLMEDLMKDMGDEDEELSSADAYANGEDYGKHDDRECSGCGKAFDRRDETVDAIGKTFHRLCYTCTTCGSRFDARHPYKEYQGRLYCERDYYEVKQGKLCASCNTPISNGRMIQALGHYYHIGHLKCHECRNPIDADKGLVEHKGRVFCREDFANLYLPKCRGCGLPVEKEAVCALDGKLEGKWHRECFGCHTCRKPFPDNTFYVFENAPYCKRHYHKLNNSLCKTCDDPIEGPCAQTIEGWRFHPACFTCVVCREAITDIYYMFENKTYCETHILQLQRHRKVRAEKRQTYFKRI